METKVYKRIAQLTNVIDHCLNSNSDTWFESCNIHEDKLDKIINDIFPSGSGFDGGTTIDYRKCIKNRIVIDSAYHHMDHNGYYANWEHFEIIITPNLAHDYDIRLKSKGRWNRKYNYTKEYILEMFVNCLDETTEI